MSVISANGLQTHYEDQGAGPTILWIAGTGLLGSIWRPQLIHFQNSYRCITFDLRGSGETTGGGDEFLVGDLAEDAIQLLEALKLTQVHIVGQSLGASIAQEVALARPDLVKGLVLLSTWSSTAREHHIRRHFESRLYCLENAPLDVFARFGFWMLAPTVIDNEPLLQAAVEEQLRVGTSTRLSGTAAHFRADLLHETQNRLCNIRCPTLVMVGEEDLITLPSYSKRVAELIPSARIVIVPRAGHLVWLERPDGVNQNLEHFLGTA